MAGSVNGRVSEWQGLRNEGLLCQKQPGQMGVDAAHQSIGNRAGTSIWSTYASVRHHGTGVNSGRGQLRAVARWTQPAERERERGRH